MVKRNDSKRSESELNEKDPIILAFVEGTKDQLTKATKDSVGYDLAYNGKDIEIENGKVAKLSTGIKLEMTSNIFASIRIRSSLAQKGILIPNSPALIDSDYRGEIYILVMNLSGANIQIRQGDRIAQLTFEEKVKITLRFKKGGSPSDSERGSKGFGSSGR